MVTINRDYQVTFLAGSSKDAETIYIDRRLPETMTLKDGRVIYTDKYLIIHEKAEQEAERRLGYKYPYAHEFYGTAAERKAVEADGVPWQEYQDFMLGMVKKLRVITGEEPPDLDTEPEHDTHDKKDMDIITEHQKGNRLPMHYSIKSYRDLILKRKKGG